MIRDQRGLAVAVTLAVTLGICLGAGSTGDPAGAASPSVTATPAATTPAATAPAATAPSATPPGAATAAGSFVPVTPARILDTAAGLGGHAPGGRAVLRLQVAGRGGVPASGVSAVVLNLIVSHPDALGYLTVYPDGTTRPGTANLAFHAGPTTTSLTVAALGPDGSVDIYNGAPQTQQLQADVTGYYLAGTPTTAGAFVPVTPARILDTAAGLGGHPPGGRAVLRLQVAGRGGVPASGVSAVVLNLIVSHPDALGYLTVYPDGATRPGTANLAFHAGPTATNLAVAKLGTDGEIDIYNGAPQTQQLQADVTGYYLAGTPTTAGAFVPVTPARILDTATGLGNVPPGGRAAIRLQVAGRGGVPASGVSAVVLNLIVSHPDALGYLTVYPDGTTRPGTANLAFHAGPTTTNLAVAKPGNYSSVDIYNGAPQTQQLQADVTGYYLGSTAPYVTGVSPAAGLTAGGTRVMITGTGFDTSAQVTFGSSAGTAVTVASSTQLTVTTPAHPAGTVPVQVSTEFGTSAITSADDYDFAGKLSVFAGRCQLDTAGPATRDCIGPTAVAADAAGDLYIADARNYLVEKVTPDGTLTVVAGTSERGAPTPGPATSSDLYDPDGIAIDQAGNLYIADDFNNVVEKVTPGGTLSIVAGTGAYGRPTPGPATHSDLDGPAGVAVDQAGNLYIADAAVVAKVTPGGTLSIMAGTGTAGAPTPGPATSSDLDGPAGVAVDQAGNLYIADTGNRVVEKVTPGGTLSIFAGTGTSGTPTPGPASSSDLDVPAGVALDQAGNLYIADGSNPDRPEAGNHVVEKVTPGGTLSIFAGTGTSGTPTPGPATHSDLDGPAGVAVDQAGNLYIADTGNRVVAKVTPGGTLSIEAGIGITYGRPTPGPATHSDLGYPSGVAVDAAGNVYIADDENSVVEKVTPGGTLSIVAGTGTAGTPTPGPATRSDLGGPTSVAVDPAGNLYIADPTSTVIEKVTPGGTLSIVAGNGGIGDPTPGPATQSRLGGDTRLDPDFNIAVDSTGNLYIGDNQSAVVEKVTPGGTLSIFAGDGGVGKPTPGPATHSMLGYYFGGVATDPAGDLYLADPFDGAVDKITPGGTLSILPGSSKVTSPSSLAVDSAGNLYIAATNGPNVVAKLTPNGTLSIVAGNGMPGVPTPGLAIDSDIFPAGVAVDSAGNLYIADRNSDDIEKVTF